LLLSIIFEQFLIVNLEVLRGVNQTLVFFLGSLHCMHWLGCLWFGKESQIQF